MYLNRIFFIGAALIGGLSLRAEVFVESKITEAQVFRSSARVTRVAAVSLEAGENTLRFQGLPSGLQSNLIQFGVGEGVETRVDHLRYEVIAERKDTAEELDLIQKIETVDAAIAVLESEKADAAKRIEFAKALGASFTEGFGEKELNADGLERAGEVLAFQEKTMVAAKERIREIEGLMEKRGKERVELRKELSELKAKLDVLRGEVGVRLFAAEAGVAQVVLGYVVNEASWFPTYTVRVNSSKNRMEMVYEANLVQYSGEDWADVAVTVSTSQPNRSGDAPVLGGVYLQPNQQWRGKEMSMKLSASSDAFGDSDGYQKSNSLSATRFALPPIPEIAAGMSSFSAKLPSRVSLATARESSRFPLMTESFEATYWSEVVALMNEKGFLKAKAKNAFQLPLIAGNAQVYIDGTLTSRVTIPHALPEEELELSLGVDEYIMVTRAEKVRKTEYAGLIDKTTVLKRTYEVEVTNLHPLTHKVKVYERFPISRNEKISVKLIEPKLSDVDYEEETGVFFWEESIKSKKKKTYTVRFEVVYPREWNLEDQI